ncbi:MAG TPA: cache domain-containing protein [Syntrophobacteraceae bacterium]|nr:cache domain-containing protein [Syntrophobacteraceae bacterium]
MNPRSEHDAKSWVDKAIAFYNRSGKRIALAEFSNPKGPFVQGDRYLFVLNPRGTMLAHGVNEAFVGEEFIDIEDCDGKPFIRELLDIANNEGSGWIEYKWYDPETRKVLPKMVYCEKVNDLIICSGVYKE